MQKHVNLVDLVKSFPTNIYLQNLASIQKRTSSVKFAHLAEKSEKGSISNLSTKAQTKALADMASLARKSVEAVKKQAELGNDQLEKDSKKQESLRANINGLQKSVGKAEMEAGKAAGVAKQKLDGLRLCFF